MQIVKKLSLRRGGDSPLSGSEKSLLRQSVNALVITDIPKNKVIKCIYVLLHKCKVTACNIATKMILSRQKESERKLTCGKEKVIDLNSWHKYKSQKKTGLMQSESQTLQVLKRLSSPQVEIG